MRDDDDDSMGHSAHYRREFGADGPTTARGDIVLFVWLLLICAALFGAAIMAIFLQLPLRPGA